MPAPSLRGSMGWINRVKIEKTTIRLLGRRKYCVAHLGLDRIKIDKILSKGVL